MMKTSHKIRVSYSKIVKNSNSFLVFILWFSLTVLLISVFLSMDYNIAKLAQPLRTQVFIM